MHRRGELIAALLVLCCVPPSAAAGQQPVWRHTPDRGFIDDCLAFDATGNRLAYVHTDSATFLHVVVVATTTGERLGEVQLDPTRIVPRSLAFTPDGSRLVVLFSDAARSTRGVMLHEVASGQPIRELVGAEDVAVVSYNGQQVVSLIARRPTKDGGTRLTVALHDTLRLKPQASGSVLISVDDTVTIGKATMRLLYWAPGHIELIALEPGAYDRKKDIRLPDLRVRYDTIKGQVLTREQRQNALAWREALEVRSTHLPQRRVARVTDNLRELQLVGPDDSVAPLRTAHPWQLYEPKSLRQHESWDAQLLHISLTVDPLNPAALAKKKAVPERVDFYRVDSSGALRLLGGTLVEKRDFAWAASTSHIAYLRKLRGFARGGKVLELYATRD